MKSLLESNAGVKGAHLFLMQVGDAGAPRLTLGLYVEGPAGQWVLPQLNRRFHQEPLDFAPYESPEIILLDSIPGGEEVRERIPALFDRDPDRPSGSPAINPDPDPAETPEFEKEEDTTSSSDASRQDEGGRRRRLMWPFRR